MGRCEQCEEKEQKEQEYRDYECSAGSCNYSIHDTKWIDTGNTSIKANGTICGCTANNTVKRCYDGNCTDTGIENSSNCCADVACDGKESNCTCGDICVITTGWWRDGGAFHPTETPIQAAIDNAIAGETICVKDGTYTENVDVDRQLTIRSENGAASTTVNALYSNDHVFEVTVDYVSISGFTVNGATGSGKAGIYLDNNIDHCNSYDNNASDNNYGIYLCESSYNMITSNTVSNKDRDGIRLSHSSNNTISDNTASNNDWCGIRLSSTSNNNRSYNNYFNNIKNNAQDDGNNIWNITKISGTNIIGGSWQGGNYWGDYAGIDTNGDGLGDTLLPYNSNGDILVGGDMHPLVPAGVAPLLSVEKTDDPDPVQVGGTLNYSIIVSNKGYANASAVTVTEIYDVNVTFDSAIPAPSLGNDMWIFPALYANETKRINISVTVNPLTAMGTVLHNTVTVSCAEGVTDTDTEATTVFSEEQNCTCGDICVITTGWWRDGGAFHSSDTPIQAAIDNATAGDTICVKDGEYNENVDVNAQLTIRSENGAASTTVNALYSNDHVFEVTADYVSILGFTVKGATDFFKAGICLDSNIDYCNIYDNNASGNYDGIDLSHSSNNTISDNNVSNNGYGIRLSSRSSNNLIYNNYFNNKNNARDDGNNIWNIAKTAGTNIIGGSWQGGNYWSDYAGIDANGDGLGDTLLPYNSNGDILVGGDMHPLVPAGIAPLLSVEKTDDPDPVQAGGTLNYSISVNNVGYMTTTNVIVTETYDANVTFDSAMPVPSGENNVWIFPALNANETKWINISVSVNPSIPIGTVLHNIVNATCDQGVTGSDTEATTVFSGELNCTCGDICVIPTGWWRDGGAFHLSDKPIQAAIDNAISGETICVKDGTYTENVDVNKRLTIRSDNGAASTTVNAPYIYDHVFEVTADHVRISGFTVRGAIGEAGISLDSNINHCNISNNTVSDSYQGICLRGSSNNNTISSNTVSNNDCGIHMRGSSSNTIHSNTASNNDDGIYLRSSSTNNQIYNNYFNNTNNAQDDGTNIWDITPTLGENIIGGSWLGGNYWSDYNGIDTNGDGLGDTLLPYNASGEIITGGDWHPLVQEPSPCFIATAAYGTPLHEDINVLRKFRDEYLMPNPVGQAMVKIYYTTSPPIADLIRANEGLRTTVRDGLVKPLVEVTRRFV